MRNDRNDYREREVKEFTEKLISVRRVTKVVKGGKNSRFCAFVAVGNGRGTIGLGMGKSTEIPEAIRKAVEDAKKNLVTIPMVNGTIPHQIVGNYGAGKVVLIPAPSGTGIIAGSGVRTVLELSGIENIRTKSLGTNNSINMAKATVDGIKNLKTVEQVAALRGKTVAEILG